MSSGVFCNDLLDQLFWDVIKGGVVQEIEPCVESSKLQELLMVPAFNDPPILQHDDLISLADGCQSMGDDYSSSVFQQAI